MERIRDRAEIPVEDTWALEDLYVTDFAWEEDFAAMTEIREHLAAYAGHLGESGDILFSYLQEAERTEVVLDRLANYCMRKADQDTRESSNQAMSGKFMTMAVEISATCSFETPEIMAIEEETLEDFYRDCPPLERYRRYITDMRRMREHVLSAQQEQLLAAAGEIAQAPDTVYSLFADADITFPDVADSQGKMYPLTQGTFVTYLESSDRILRKNAYENLYDGFTRFRNTTAGLLDAQNKQLKFFATARKYSSAFEASLDRTNVPTDVYLNLIQTVHENADKMHRYIRLRKKLLGVDTLHFYDLYTPLVSGVDSYIPYAQAKQTVYDALAPLGEEYQKILREGFDNRWIDVYQNQGKRSGAYSAGASVHPYVLLNYTGTLDSQFTLAHEMGHALHSYFSNRRQNPIDANYVIFVAEVASTCNEALLMEHLLAQTTDRKQRAYLINHFLDQFRGTIYRQTMFAEFELNIGKLVTQGKTLTAEILCEEYRRLNVLYYGSDIEVDDRIAMEWARIPHFYYDYYVFQYATGYAAAIALSRRILEEGKPAVEDYLNFLSGGRTKSPIDLLRGAGVDMTTATPIQSALDLFGRLLDEMEQLMEES